MVAGLLCSHLWASAQDVYTWTDEKGRKHFADKVSTPENRRDKPVNIPPPNVAKRFAPSQPNGATGTGDASPGLTGAMPVVSADPKPPEKKKPKVMFTNEECDARKAAYAASEACFVECATPTVHQSKNNANCGHCTQMSMPRC
jgi:hypothetical protein